MADVRPFRAIRPQKGMEERIAALPYDVYTREEAAKEVQNHPDSFLVIDRPESQFPPDMDMYAPQVYEKAGELLWQKVAEGVFIQEDKPCYYLYRLKRNGRSQTGIVACVSIDDYCHHVIKKHENTRADKEEDRIRHVEACECQTGPIFLAYRSNEQCRQVMTQIVQELPLYDFTTQDGVTHQVWKIEKSYDIEKIGVAFRETESVYIADGHHRCASAVKVGLRRREQCPTYSGKEPFNFFLSVLFPEEELQIMDYNRVVRDLNGLTQEDFLNQVKNSFLVQKEEKAFHPSVKGMFGMYLGNRWYSLHIKPDIQSEDVVAGLDVSILQDALLGPVLGIQDPRTDNRILFVGGIRGLEELENQVHNGMAAAFSLHPTSIQELFAVADSGRLMPPKSTWFEPKLRSGLFLHSLREENKN